MARSLKVHLTVPDFDLLHQWRNFGEDVYRVLRDECEVSLEEIDASSGEFHVRGIHKRELRAIAARVGKIAGKNLMADMVRVSEVPEDHSA